MQREAAKKLVKDTFERPFNKEQFSRFAKNLLNRVEDSTFTYRGNLIFHDFKDQVQSLERIGKYQDAEGNKIDILIVQLVKDTSLERARAAQRKFVAKYLKGSRGGELKDAALVAFVSPDEQDWRFSFVKMEYKIKTTDKGRIKVEEEFTPARRYSFLVGTNENSHTAQSRLLPILENTDRNPTLAEIEESFSVEKVTKEFYEQYRKLFDDITEALETIVKDDKIIKANFEAKGVDTINFAKKLLGQIVFLYFLQKKGWFGVARNATWGTGPKGFLRQLFVKKLSDYDNFFNDILEPLFYEALAVEREADYYSKFKCKIPFLNGGLFDPLNNYDWVETDILLPNELFSNLVKTKQGDIGTGILDVFDRYNFTVKEDEPLEKEVAVDPEMLGKVFENLLEIKDRKSKGTYYTPREIVHYMCQESLISYLATELEGKINHEDVETLVKHGEAAIENDTRVMESGRETKDYRFKLPEAIRENAKVLDDKLADIKVCDPAVGSGAFLVGMMTEITRSRQALTLSLSNPQRRTAYDLKRDAIQNSLHGVDIDPGAVEIAKLRLWLSLIVDEEDYKHIKPLPNLDYKIMQGNSLLEEYEGIKLIDEKFFERQEESAATQERIRTEQSRLQREYFELHSKGRLTKFKKAELEKRLKSLEVQLKALMRPQTNDQDSLRFDGKSEEQSKAEQLLRLHERFFATYHKREKDELKERIGLLTWELIETTLTQDGKTERLSEVRRFQENNTQPFFLWRLNFADVFRDKHGFDVVIANPPYIRQEAIEYKQFLSHYAISSGTADLYCYFYELAYRILSKYGTLTFITSNKYLRANYGKKLRRFLKDRLTLRTLIDFGDLPVFKATAYPSVLVARKGLEQGTSFSACSIESEEELSQFESVLNQRCVEMQQEALPDEDVWSIEQPGIAALKRKIEGTTENTKLPKDYINGRMYRGILTGYNEAFVIDTRTRDQLVVQDSKCVGVIKPYLRGRDIKRYAIDEPRLYLIYIPNGWTNAHRGNRKPQEFIKSTLPAIYQHLIAFKKILEEREDQGQYWWELRPCRYDDEFERPKIIWGNLSKKPGFTYDTAGYYINAPANILVTDNLYLLGVLNSGICSFTIFCSAAQRSGGFLEFKPMYVERVPIRIPTEQQRAAISQRVEQVLKLKKQHRDASSIEQEIDQLVYKIYCLTPEEISVVEGQLDQG